MRCGQRNFPLSTYTAGAPPLPLGGGGGDITPPYLQSIAVICCGFTAKWDRQKRLEWSLASSFHTKGYCLTDILPLSLSSLVSVAWMWDVGVTSYVFVFASDYPQLRGEHQLCPIDPATVLHQFLVPFRLRLVPTVDSPGPGPPDVWRKSLSMM